MNEIQKSESIKNLATAQMKMQKELKNLDLNAKGFNYKYTSLDNLLEYARNILSKHGLSFLQMPIGSDTTIGLETIYMHESGEWISSKMESPIGAMKGLNVYQSSGSAITYFRRYALMSFMGVFGEEDKDASDKVFNNKKINSNDLPF